MNEQAHEASRLRRGPMLAALLIGAFAAFLSENLLANHKKWYDPQIGELEFEHVTLQPPTHPDLKIMIYSASPDTAARLGNIVVPESSQ